MRLVATRPGSPRPPAGSPAHAWRRASHSTVDFFRDPANLARYKTGIYNI